MTIRDTYQQLDSTLEQIAATARAVAKGKKLAWLVIVTAPTSDADNTALVLSGGTVSQDSVAGVFNAVLTQSINIALPYSEEPER